MINKKALLMVAAALATALIVSSLAVMRTARSVDEIPPATPMFLWIGGLSGEVTVAGHEHWIEIDAFNWGEAMTSLTSAIGGRNSAKLNMTNFHFAMTTNLLSPTLFLECATGRIRDACLDVCKIFSEHAVVFLRFNLTQTAITSYSIGGSTSMERPVDEFSIAFSRITMTYYKYGDGGGLVGSSGAYYDLIAGRGDYMTNPLPPA